MHLLLIDNYDSFTYNLYHLFASLVTQITVVRNDADADAVFRGTYDAVCISPGPKTPKEAGISGEAVERFAGEVPILGVCLGMQVINEVYGGRTVKAPLPVHGKPVRISHNGDRMFEGIPSPFAAARYHSLIVDMRGSELTATAWSEEEGVIMALRHVSLPIFGVQYHPESFMSEHGEQFIQTFLSGVHA
ncbi:MAG: anthranilate/aminodeoxychorismate synthase component II [Ectothiorhodospiraceae bacterium]|nr:anthranilate/aminodeoxychorismate synthase component II [Ectothiorhodospiraceae bacterium]